MSGRRDRERRREERLQGEGEAAGQERRRRLVKLGSAVAFLAVAALLVAVVISQSQSDGGDASDVRDTALVANELRGLAQDGLILGDPAAPQTIVEFGDLQCPACKQYATEVIPELIEGPVRRGDARLEFRNFVILGPQSSLAAAAAVAAGRQGRGWNFVELFYRNQGIEHSGYVTDEFLAAIARGAGVPDMARWNADRGSATVKREVNRTSAQASNLGLTGTPSFAIQSRGGALEPLGLPGSAAEIESALSQAD